MNIKSLSELMDAGVVLCDIWYHTCYQTRHCAWYHVVCWFAPNQHTSIIPHIKQYSVRSDTTYFLLKTSFQKLYLNCQVNYLYFQARAIFKQINRPSGQDFLQKLRLEMHTISLAWSYCEGDHLDQMSRYPHLAQAYDSQTL